MKISVIVPCYNAAPYLARQLEALERQSVAPFEVIVADNGSTDGSIDVARGFEARLPKFRLVDAGAKSGASFARNAGAHVASGEFLAFCDADDEVAPGWLEGLEQALSQYDFVASRFDLTKLNPRVSYVHPQATGLIHERPFDCLPRAGGCGLAIRRAIHEAVGGFDETIRFHEDTDYCWKVQLKGTPLGWAPAAEVHVQFKNSPAAMFRQARLWSKSEVTVYKRYRPLGIAKVSNEDAIKEWFRLGVLVMRVLLGRASTKNLAWRLGTRIGRLQGSIFCLMLML